MLLSSEINLFPDGTVFVQLGIFLAVAALLNTLVFKPILRIMDLRRSKTEGDRRRIEELKNETEKLIQSYETRMVRAREEALQIKDGIRRQGEEEGQRLIHETKQAVLAQFNGVKASIEAETKKAAESLESQAAGLGRMIAEKILGH